MKKYLILIFIFIWLFSFSAKAEDTEDFYSKQYSLSGIDETYEKLPQETRDFLEENELTPENPDFVNNLTVENVFSHIWGFLKSGAKKPITSGAALLAVILISAAVMSGESGTASQSAKYATVISAVAVISAPIFSVITSGVKAMQGSAVFMTSFIPIFAVVVAASGGAVTSVSMSALLLTASQGVNFIANFLVLPLMGGYLALSLSAAVSPVISKTGIADGIKKLAMWTMSLTSTVFIGVLSIQTAVNSAADTLTLKTAKFIIGSSVPVAGTALSEALTTVTASMGILKAGVGIYGVIACFIIFLPLLAELLIWRAVLGLNAVFADLLGIGEISSVIRSVDNVMSVLVGLLLLIGAVFIISLTVVVGAVK